MCCRCEESGVPSDQMGSGEASAREVGGGEGGKEKAEGEEEGRQGEEVEGERSTRKGRGHGRKERRKTQLRAKNDEWWKGWV